MTDLSVIIELFKGTLFYPLIVITTVFTVSALGFYLKDKQNIKQKAESFKNDILEKFASTKIMEAENEKDKLWEEFFNDVLQYQRAEKSEGILREIKTKVEEFSEKY
ncbi:MAG: hypothetical protein JSV12_00345 [Candidatus Bathyarchaeota archaeon]|nr:MAG: hypothetical protein JSV12_00345 [Candidatus Bathyarchaeota archaeon]